MTPMPEICRSIRVDSLEARAHVSRHEIASLIAWVRLERNARKLSVALLLVAVNVALSRYVPAAIAGLAIGTAALATVFRVMSYLEARDYLKQMSGPPFGADRY